MKIVLIGYMGSGKSVIGAALSKKKNLEFIDLDSYIEKKEDCTISDIFKFKGEIYFRKIEGVYLKELLSSSNNFILSLGGGTPCYGKNMDLILHTSNSIYLKSSISELFNRLKNETNHRPLIATIGLHNLKEYIAKHLFERAPYYEQATIVIETDKKSITKIVDEIESLV